MHDRLETLRREIDGLDTRLITLFEKRLTLCESIGAAKREAGLPTLDASRERAVIERCLAYVDKPRHQPYVERFARAMIDLCREYQQREAPHTNGKGEA